VRAGHISERDMKKAKTTNFVFKSERFRHSWRTLEISLINDKYMSHPEFNIWGDSIFSQASGAPPINS
jgi:hypothetical protein